MKCGSGGTLFDWVVKRLAKIEGFNLEVPEQRETVELKARDIEQSMKFLANQDGGCDLENPGVREELLRVARDINTP